MLNRVCLPLALLLIATGCASTRTEVFDVDVHNQTNQPLTLSLAKDGPPFELAWASPEDLAIESPKLREDWQRAPSGMSLLPPGKSASIQHLTGRFDSGSHGILRAYASNLTISQMLSKSRGSPDRVDVQLQPGHNDITIVQELSHLKAQVDQPAGK